MKTESDYRDIECPNCQRRRVQDDGVCEKCLWDVDGGDYAGVTRPDEYNAQGFIYHHPDENLIVFGDIIVTDERGLGPRFMPYGLDHSEREGK